MSSHAYHDLASDRAMNNCVSSQQQIRNQLNANGSIVTTFKCTTKPAVKSNPTNRTHSAHGGKPPVADDSNRRSSSRHCPGGSCINRSSHAAVLTARRRGPPVRHNCSSAQQ